MLRRTVRQLPTRITSLEFTWLPPDTCSLTLYREQICEHTVTLTEVEAWEFAQFLKRVCFSDYRGHATSDDEAYHMIDAGERIRSALAGQGYVPR
jgi:hypothetical protein